jgi:uncharacterized protein (TIGR03435 family)
MKISGLEDDSMQCYVAQARSCAGRYGLLQVRVCLGTILILSAVCVRCADAQVAFAAATIKPSAESVKFESDGNTETSPGTLKMRDVTVNTCIKWAYRVQDSQISGPGWLRSQRYDIVAKADGPASDERMKEMMRTLLAERFKLGFHRENKELRALVMTVAKGGAKLHEAASDGKAWRQNSTNGMVAKSTTMQEFADFISGPLQMPVVDETGLTDKYDFAIDFSTYLPDEMRTMNGTKPDATGIILAALEGELGLKMESRKAPVQVMVVDHVEKPSEN